MTVKLLNREQAVQRALASKTCVPGKCQAWTRQLYNAPAVGDVDKDGDSDAVDGWRSEPEETKHRGDYNPPRGVPLAWKGGSSGFGHRAISLGERKVRSIDVNGPGTVGTVDIKWFERNWDMEYIGWSETISGILIPKVVRPPAPTKKSNMQIAREVIDGRWGHGADRVKRLKKAGYNAKAIQELVNKLLK